MAVRCIQEGLCEILSLDEVKHYLNVDDNSAEENAYLESLIGAVASEASNFTGRIFVESKWEWVIDNLKLNAEIEFPLCPVTKVEIFDLDEILEDEQQQRTDLSSKLVKVNLPSLLQQGTPLIGTLLPINEFPANYQLVLTVGYPNNKTEKLIPQTSPIELDTEKITYTASKVNLVFNRPIKGEAQPQNFKLSVAQVTTITNEETGEEELIVGEPIEYEPQSVNISNGCVILEFLENEIVDKAQCKLSFIGGMIEDDFDNFLQPLDNVALPDVVLATEADFMLPNPNPVEVTYTSTAPKQIKQWVYNRIGTLYQQRSQVAPRGLGAMYGSNFIDGLLKQYKVVFR